MKSSGEVCSIAHEILKPLTEFNSKRVNSYKSFSSNMRIELNRLIKCLESTVIALLNSKIFFFWFYQILFNNNLWALFCRIPNS